MHGRTQGLRRVCTSLLILLFRLVSGFFSSTITLEGELCFRRLAYRGEGIDVGTRTRTIHNVPYIDTNSESHDMCYCMNSP